MAEASTPTLLSCKSSWNLMGSGAMILLVDMVSSWKYQSLHMLEFGPQHDENGDLKWRTGVTGGASAKGQVVALRDIV